ncbi:hypothetical protein [Coralliovum pocilloporae]|uniref:hypothetical protein n=1 Tax=Coralliovum pocilloporae TaxID=3066369 RepID=UPI003306D6EA
MENSFSQNGSPSDSAASLNRDALTAANINPDTYLATDYLNHFNEVVMLIEMLSSMPDCAEDVLGWSPMTYDAYFKHSHFKDKALALEAFNQASHETRDRLDTVVAEIDRHMLQVLENVENAVHTDDPSAFDMIAFKVSSEIRPLLDQASSVINGVSEKTDPMLAAELPTAQVAVDALFD